MKVHSDTYKSELLSLVRLLRPWTANARSLLIHGFQVRITFPEVAFPFPASWALPDPGLNSGPWRSGDSYHLSASKMLMDAYYMGVERVYSGSNRFGVNLHVHASP